MWSQLILLYTISWLWVILSLVVGKPGRSEVFKIKLESMCIVFLWRFGTCATLFQNMNFQISKRCTMIYCWSTDARAIETAVPKNSVFFFFEGTDDHLHETMENPDRQSRAIFGQEKLQMLNYVPWLKLCDVTHMDIFIKTLRIFLDMSIHMVWFSGWKNVAKSLCGLCDQAHMTYIQIYQYVHKQ